MFLGGSRHISKYNTIIISSTYLLLTSLLLPNAHLLSYLSAIYISHTVDTNISFLYTIIIKYFNTILLYDVGRYPWDIFWEYFSKLWGTGEKCQGSKTCKKNKGSVPSMVKFKQRFFIVEEKMPRVKFLMFCLCFY